MRLFVRQDALLIAALTAAVLIAFSPALSHVLDYARAVERQTGLALLPALLVLAVALFFHLFHRQQQAQLQTAAAERASREAETRGEEFERFVAFGQALGRSPDIDSIRAAIGQYLAALAGTDRVWVLVRQGTEWQALSSDTRGPEGVLQWGDLAEQLLSSGSHDRSGDQPAQPRALGFPLVVGGTALGVLGVRPETGVLVPERRRMLEAAAALLALSVKNAQLFREVRDNSVRDSLTGCFTRGHALDVIDAELRRARRSQTPVSLIMFDLDHFKEVNDRYGHLCGDAVLSTIGMRMKEVLRGSDLKCRHGGEEFLVLLPETPLHGARRVAETLRREIAERPIAWSGEALTITASFGLAQTMPGEVNVQAVIARADQALYRAKDDGRNCVRIASESPSLVAEVARQTANK